MYRGIFYKAERVLEPPEGINNLLKGCLLYSRGISFLLEEASCLCFGIKSEVKGLSELYNVRLIKDSALTQCSIFYSLFQQRLFVEVKFIQL